ncbi:hypothetical protein, partial [Staphylococcus sp. 11007852]|uniref:hypothetical protein n=1 Tax=Staphylococcus sp. 11007852 TaxID=2714543 RepID=UPI001B316EC2
IILGDEVKRKDMKVNKSSKRYVFRKATLQYFKAMLEFPDRITNYDIYMFIVCLKDSSDIDRQFFIDIAKVICKSGVNPKSKEEYNKSLLSHFINQPRYI